MDGCVATVRSVRPESRNVSEAGKEISLRGGSSGNVDTRNRGTQAYPCRFGGAANHGPCEFRCGVCGRISKAKHAKQEPRWQQVLNGGRFEIFWAASSSKEVRPPV